MKMERNGYYKVFGSVAAIIGVIFSIFYIVFSIYAIGTFENANFIPDTASVTDFIYLMFLRDCENFCLEDIKVTSKTFNGFMYCYLITHIVWLIVNGIYLYVIIRSKWASFKSIHLFWTGNTTIILLMELILVSLLADDFTQIRKYEKIIDLFSSESNIIDRTYVLMFALVTQFYLFWIVNFIFVAINTYHIFNKSTFLPNPVNPEQNSIIYAYGNRTAPPFSEIYNNPANNVYTNPAYVTDTGAFNRSQSFEDFSNPYNNINNYPDGTSNYFNFNPESIKKTLQNPNEPNNRPNTNNNYSSFLYGHQNNNRSYTPPGSEYKTATIGRRQGRNITPPLKVSSPKPPYPFIPPPDYTPPSSPLPKSILRSNSKF